MPPQTGGIGAILRREGLYSSALTELAPPTRCRGHRRPEARLSAARKPPNLTHLATELTRLQQDNARLTQRLTRAEAIIDIQKKVAALLGIPLAPSDDEP